MGAGPLVEGMIREFANLPEIRFDVCELDVARLKDLTEDRIRGAVATMVGDPYDAVCLEGYSSSSITNLQAIPHSGYYRYKRVEQHVHRILGWLDEEDDAGEELRRFDGLLPEHVELQPIRTSILDLRLPGAGEESGDWERLAYYWADQGAVIEALGLGARGWNQLVLTENFNRCIVDTISLAITPASYERTLFCCWNQRHADQVFRFIEESHCPWEEGAAAKVLRTVGTCTDGIARGSVSNLVLLHRIGTRGELQRLIDHVFPEGPQEGGGECRLIDAVGQFEPWSRKTGGCRMLHPSAEEPEQW